MSAWIRLHHLWRTEQVYQAINLLAEYHICVKTKPDEFSGKVGSERLLTMDSDILWPLYVKRKHLAQTIAILTEEHLIPFQGNFLEH